MKHITWIEKIKAEGTPFHGNYPCWQSELFDADGFLLDTV